MDTINHYISPVLRSSQIYGRGQIGEFIVTNGLIYFIYFTEHSTLMRFDIESSEITRFNIVGVPVLSLSPDKNELHFSHGIGTLSALSLNYEDAIPQNIMPSNADALSNFPVFIVYRTITDGRIAFSVPNVEGSRIFIINEENYAEEIFFSEGVIDMYINAFGNWIYFTVLTQHDRSIHLYRIKNDGTEKELIYSHLASAEFGLPVIFLNVFNDDLILFKMNPIFHTIYALVRCEYSHEFTRKVLNSFYGAE